MFVNIIIMAILIIAIIFFLGFIGHLIYLLITPSKKLSTEDFGKKNILFKYFKNIKIIFYECLISNKNGFFIYLIPGIDFSIEKFNLYNKYYLDFNWLFWSISFQYNKIR
jgi:hypothetical protein